MKLTRSAAILAALLVPAACQWSPPGPPFTSPHPDPTTTVAPLEAYEPVVCDLLAPSVADDPDGAAFEAFADDMFDTDYRSGVWYGTNGHDIWTAIGYASTEDGAVYSRPGCEPVLGGSYQCLRVPPADDATKSVPLGHTLNYDGPTNAWSVDGVTIGHSLAEDDGFDACADSLTIGLLTIGSK